MSFSKNSFDKNDENYKILNKKQQNESNEIKLIKRTLQNNTHEVIEDTKLKRITSWRKSQSKFLKSLIYNILSFGIIHLISLFYPNLYIKLYCNPCQAKDCDFFLVEDVYGYYTLCLKIHKKGNKNKNMYFDTKENFITSFNNNIPNKNEYSLAKNLTYSFTYKSMNFEYNDETNEIIPVYMNLSKLTNKGILNFFSEGLSTEAQVMKFRQRYGLNEYYINTNILYLYFKKVEIPNFISVIINGIIEFILSDFSGFSIKIVIVLFIIIHNFMFFKKVEGNLCKKEYTIDGEKHLKVRRKYLLKENNFYAEIKNKDLLPGDIIFLKSNDIVPCDCLIMEGECIANESNSTGSLDIFKKISIENNNQQFNYKYNNNNILFHGMKIIKTISKLNEGFISVLCINTGPNTYKANQYSNILYLSERRKDYNKNYHCFGGERKIILIVTICLFLLDIILGIGYIFIFKLKITKIKEFIVNVLLRALCKSLMPIYFLINSIIILYSAFRLKSENIICYDKSRLIKNTGRIDTIFISKTGTLCQNAFEIRAYHPVYINPHKHNSISYTTYKQNQCKEMNIQLLKYYKEYLFKKNVCNYNSRDFNLRYCIRKNQNQLNAQQNDIALFLECLLSCNNLDKFNTDIFGNVIESKIFNDMKWDIKVHENNDFFYNTNINDNLYKNRSRTNSANNIFYDNKFIFVNKKIYDIFPRNYYKITELSNNEITNNDKCPQKKKTNKYLDKNIKNPRIYSLKEDISISSDINPILNDINLFDIKSYKLRIFKKFIIDGTLNSSAIVYNFLTKELRFMIKGMAEEILDKCDINSLPENFSNTISYYRKKGYIIIICATKLINIEEYNDLNEYEFYLNNLSFCGFITLRNILKNDIQNSIHELKKFDCNLIIISGDNEYNCLSAGFDSGIIDNKNIFVFDKDDKSNKILIRKIYSNKAIKEFNDEDTKKSNNNPEKYAKQKYKINQSIFMSLYETKENRNLRYNKSLINISNLKRNISDNKESDNKRKDIKEYYTPKIREENKIFLQNDNDKKKSIIEKYSPLNFANILRKENSRNISVNSEINEINKNEDRDKLSKSIINNPKIENKKNQDSNSHKKTKNSTYKYNNLSKKTTLREFEKFYFYCGIFNDYEDLKDNCIYCVSGKVINYLYKNKKNKEYKSLLKQIHKKCKIYFQMSSIDKSVAIDFYKEYPNSYICIIGECQSDFDPIMTSNVGINIKAPKNYNTILCHFYNKDANIICIKKLILEGRTVDENISLLKVSSYFCTMIINSYIFTCFINNNDVVIGQLNILELIYLLLSILTFTGDPDNNYTLNPLLKNNKLFNFHYYIQIVGIFLIKLVTIYFACDFYKKNIELEDEKVDRIFISYYFILCIELIFSIVFSFNYISFSKKSIFSNTFFIIFILIMSVYFIDLICLNSSNFKKDILKITYFEDYKKLIDSFDDKNRINLFFVCILDYLFSFLFSRITYFIFFKLAQYKTKENKENNQ